MTHRQRIDAPVQETLPIRTQGRDAIVQVIGARRDVQPQAKTQHRHLSGGNVLRAPAQVNVRYSTQVDALFGLKHQPEADAARFLEESHAISHSNDVGDVNCRNTVFITSVRIKYLRFAGAIDHFRNALDLRVSIPDPRRFRLTVIARRNVSLFGQRLLGTTGDRPQAAARLRELLRRAVEQLLVNVHDRLARPVRYQLAVIEEQRPIAQLDHGLAIVRDKEERSLARRKFSSQA